MRNGRVNDDWRIQAQPVQPQGLAGQNLEFTSEGDGTGMSSPLPITVPARLLNNRGVPTRTKKSAQF